MGILDQIAQPQLADIAGALDVRQKRLDADEAKRKEIRMGQLIAEATPNLKKDSALYSLAINSPKEYMVLSKHLGIPLNSGEQMQQFVSDTNDLYLMAQADPRDAYEHAIQLKSQRNAQGVETPQIDKFIHGMEEDPQRTMTGLFTMHRSLNPETSKDGFTLGEGQTRYDAKGNVIASVAPKPKEEKNVDTADLRRQINQEISKTVNPVNEVVLAAKDLDALKTSNSPASQVAAVFKFMKSLDPTSAVRESEQGQVYEAQGAGAAMAGKLNKLLGEGALNKAAFEDLVMTAKNLANSSVDNANGQVDSYLATYEDTLPEGFKGKLKERLPKRFDTSTPSASSIDDLVNKYAK